MVYAVLSVGRVEFKKAKTREDYSGLLSVQDKVDIKKREDNNSGLLIVQDKIDFKKHV